MTREDFLSEMVEHGHQLAAIAAANSDRIDFLTGMVSLAEDLPRPAIPHRKAFALAMAEHGRALLACTEAEHLALDDLQRGWIDLLGAGPDLLAPMRRSTYEPVHTQLLAHFLAPERVPQLGEAPLRAFLALIARRLGNPALHLQEGVSGPLVIEAEYDLARFRVAGRADLWLDLPHATVLVELKIDAWEGPEQLRDYRRALDRSAQKPLRTLVFLTVRPDQRPSAEDGVHITFSDLLAAWLPIAASGVTTDHQYLRQYLTSIARTCDLAGVGAFHEWTHPQRYNAVRLARAVAS